MRQQKRKEGYDNEEDEQKGGASGPSEKDKLGKNRKEKIKIKFSRLYFYELM